MQQSLELRTTQQLTLSPQIVQAIRFLQLSAADLEHEVEEALANNPCLERTESAAQPATASSTATTAGADEEAAEPAQAPATASESDDDGEGHDPWTSTTSKRSDDERPIGEGYALSVTLRDHLIEQLAGSRLSEYDRLVVEIVIDGLDDDGYLRQTPAELLSALTGWP